VSNLIPQIRAEYAEVEKAEGCALVHAIACGDCLRLAKGNLKHNEWQAWLTVNVPEIAERTARQYMRLAARKNDIEKAANENGRTSAVLSINEADKLLRKPRTPRPSVNHNKQLDEQPLASAPMAAVEPRESKPDPFYECLKAIHETELFDILKQVWEAEKINKLEELLEQYLDDQQTSEETELKDAA
jgi:hypothetical protein